MGPWRATVTESVHCSLKLRPEDTKYNQKTRTKLHSPLEQPRRSLYFVCEIICDVCICMWFVSVSVRHCGLQDKRRLMEKTAEQKLGQQTLKFDIFVDPISGKWGI